jgi:hypothetical protein
VTRRTLDDLPAACALAAASLTVSLLAGFQLFDLRVLFQSDVWFHVDHALYRWWFTETPTVTIRHPLLPIAGYGITSGLATVLELVGFGRDHDWLVRQWLVMLFVPIANAARTAVLYAVFRRLTGRQWLPVALCVLDIISSANIVSGFAPESFPFTALCLAAMLWMMVASMGGKAVHLVWWILTGTAAVGITTTNVILLVALLGSTLLAVAEPWGRALVRTTAAAAVALAVNGCIVAVAIAASGDTGKLAIGATTDAMHSITMQETTELAFAIGHSFLAPPPSTDAVLKSREENPDYDFAFSYRHTHGWPSLWRAALTVLLCCVGAVGLWRQREWRMLLLPAALIVVGHSALFLVWGDHYIVYTLHWSAVLLVAMSGIANLRVGRTAASALLAAFVVLTALNSWLLWQHLTATLAQA